MCGCGNENAKNVGLMILSMYRNTQLEMCKKYILCRYCREECKENTRIYSESIKRRFGI